MLKKLMLNKWHSVIVFIPLLLVWPDSIYATPKYSALQINGFIMQSFVKTDKNNFFGDSVGKGSFDYREIGINASFKVSPKLQLASQLLSRYAGKTDNGEVKLDFLLADYRIVDKNTYGVGVIVGRIKNPFGFYNETRDVSFTRENIILPQSIYFERTRDVSVSADGAQVYGHRQTSLGLFKAKIGLALPRATDVNTEYVLLGNSRPGQFVAKPSFVGRLKYETNNSRIIAAYSYVNLYMDYVPSASEAASFSRNGEINFKMHIVSLKYNLMKWSFTGEYALRNIVADGLAVYIPPIMNNKTGESFYLQSIYRFTQKWNLIGRYDVLYADKDDRDGTKLATLLSGSPSPIMNYSRYAKDIMLGIQFNVNRFWMARLELHTVDGTAWLPKQDNPNSSLAVRKWNMVNASVSYRF